MSSEPKDKTQKPTPSWAIPNSSQLSNQIKPTASKETAHEEIMKAISANPTWSEALKSEKGFVIVGAKP
jgi:hypothetical protein